MGIVTLDFETYYDSSYSLRRMSEIEYILDPRFETILCAVKVDHAPTEIHVGHGEVARRLAAIDWSRNALLAHNTRFDGTIAAWHYGVQPKLYLDTLGMARATTHAVVGRSSLEKVSKYLGLPPKGDEVMRMIGVNLAALRTRPNELVAYVEYCKRDADNCRAIFDRLRSVFSATELALIDLLLRMFIEPQVLLDSDALALHLGQVQADRAAIMARVSHIDPSTFSSNPKFAALLEAHGVEVPRKISPTTGEETWALAKNDRAFKELCDDDTQPLEVQALLAARINAKSTLEETRTKTLLNLSLREWGTPVDSVAASDASRRGWAPIPLKYWGAHTGRVSGDGGFNWTNFKRGSPIRGAVKAPKGYRIAHRDASQIEARMVAWLARCTRLLDAFAQGRDVYSEFASTVYGRRVTKADKGDRFVGKTSILGLGYGMGGPRFRHTLFIGNGGMSLKIDDNEAYRIVKIYRDTYPEIPSLWADSAYWLESSMDQAQPIAIGGARSRRMMLSASYRPIPAVKFGAEAIWLPNGMCIAYPGLCKKILPPGQARRDTGVEIVYTDPYGAEVKLFGGKVVENISQALARIVITDIAVRVYQSTGYWMWMHTYDSLDYCVPEHEAPAFDALLDREFVVRPAWAPDLPLASEGGWGVTLMDAEKGVNN